MPQRRFPHPWRFEPIPGGYRVIDANGLALAHVYGQPPDAIAVSHKRLTDDEAEKLARLIVRAAGAYRECLACRPFRHLYIEPLSLGLLKRMPVPEVANYLVCSVCGARNDEIKRPIRARPDARVPGVTGKYPRW
jgi:hypothetical protein